ncbi:hypothetical protein PRIC1_006625 [Phytophthora ramorum]
MAVGIPTGFVRKLYRILDHESAAVIAWDADGASFSIHDSAALDAQILPRYFRGRLCAFRQQLVDHGFARCDCEENELREKYKHPEFQRGQPGRLSKIERKPKRNAKPKSKNSVETPKPQMSLKVTLNVPPKETRKRSQADAVQNHQAKRIRTQQQLPAPKTSKNPLFSDDSESGTSLAKFVGLLPASSELPDPISYLSKAGGVVNAAQQAPATAEETGPMFSDDMVRSAMFFLVSSSGAESNAATVPVVAPATAAATASTSGFLAALLASSSTGGTAATPFARGTNPLFSDQAADGDEDSIWNILVSSSVDRVRSAIDAVESQQDKLRLILEEREKLEEQREKVGAPTGPIVPRRLATNSNPQRMENSLPQKQQNPLFAADTAGSSAGEQSQPAEDDLWKLLMSSSIDCFRRVDLGL